VRGFAAIGLYAPKVDGNVAGALRAAGCYGAAMIAIEGARYKRLPEDTQAVSRHTPVLHGVLSNMVPEDCVPVVVELCEKASPLHLFVHPERAFYIFGPEDGSVPENYINGAKHVVYVPTVHCMNLAATVNVVLYDRLSKQSRPSSRGEKHS
jgi:tRNA(Leu) C34 or U34 (ribose-2'-O)-methylase TrmL